MDKCPSPEHLRHFAARDAILGDAQMKSIDSHVETCRKCQDVLRRINESTAVTVRPGRIPPRSDPMTKRPRTVTEFLESLEASGLLSEAQLDEAREIMDPPGDPGDLPELAASLVRRNLINGWQKDRLLDGETKLKIHGYRLLGLIGVGGMGEVYLSEQQPPIGRPVAVKLIRKGSQGFASTGETKERFRREIQVLGCLDHPNIVQLHDAGEDGDDLYFVMQYVKGSSLRDILRARGGGLSPGEACDYIRQAAFGLHHASKNGVVHRDIKPSNMMITDVDGERFLKLLDFGIARIPDQDDRSPLTHRDVLGTYVYMAPEQRNNSHHVDIRADIYSLGLILFELLKGRLPQSGEERSPDAAVMRELPPHVPGALARVVTKMLAREPGDRYQTHKQVAVALEPFVSGGHAANYFELFEHRLDATPDMIGTLHDCRKLVFFGISHQKLSGYFKEVMRAAGPGAPPWRSIEIYYAHNEIGERWFEGSDFHANLRRTRQEIASTLLGHAHRPPDLKEVSFRQSLDARFQTGCLVGIDQGEGPDFDIAYLIGALVPEYPELSLTFKIDMTGEEISAPHRLRESIAEIYRRAKENSRSLGTYGPTAWDYSVEDWARYCRTAVQRRGMETLVKSVAFSEGDRVLELAAGTGDLSKLILDRLADLPDTQLTVLDASPAMLEGSKATLGKSVTYALCRVPTDADQEDIDLRKPGTLGKISANEYSIIIINNSISTIVTTRPTLQRLANWCAGHLRPDGRVVLSALNTFVRLGDFPSYDPNEDPLRQAMRRTAREMSIDPVHLRAPFSPVMPNDIETGFAAAGFQLDSFKFRRINFP